MKPAFGAFCLFIVIASVPLWIAFGERSRLAYVVDWLMEWFTHSKHPLLTRTKHERKPADV